VLSVRGKDVRLTSGQRPKRYPGAKPIADIFLSYNRDDASVARTYAEAFKREGFDVWWDAELKSGEAYDEVTETALRSAKAVVVLWSARSVASRWVRAEATVADRNKTLMPVMIEPCERPIMFELTQTAELGHWDGAADEPAWIAFVADVRRIASQERQPYANGPVQPSAPALHSIPESERVAELGSMPSIAILPFTNRSRIEDDDIFAEELVEDISAALSRSAMLRVLGSISTAHLKKGTFTDLAAVGEQLGVRYLLEGNVRRTGQDLKVTAQLIAPATGELLWTGHFARPLENLQQLQEELVAEVAASLDVKIQNIDMERAHRKPADLTAWEAIQRSILLLRRADVDSFKSALKEANRAVELAPDFGPAHAAAASYSANIYQMADPDDPAKVSQIHDCARKALEIDPKSEGTLWCAANAYALTGFPEKGLPLAKKAYNIAPNHGFASNQLGLCHCLMGQSEEAMKYLEIASSLLPDSHMRVWPVYWQAVLLFQERRWEKAEGYAEECLFIVPDFFPAHLVKAYAYWHDGSHGMAIQSLSRLQELGVTREQADRYTGRCYTNVSFAIEFSENIDEMWAAFDASQTG